MPAAAAEPCIRRARIRRCGISCLYVPFLPFHLFYLSPPLLFSLLIDGGELSNLRAKNRRGKIKKNKKKKKRERERDANNA
jgi:hypothetical protein